jgi:O-methyltransferase
MHNVFITELMDWKPRDRSKAVRLVNRVLEAVGSRARLVTPRSTGMMTNTEQRMNLFHLVRQVLVYGVPGDLVDLGCYLGQTGVLFAKVMAEYDPERRLHTYDVFSDPETLRIARENFKSVGGRMPEIHKGWLKDLLPGELPDSICFAQIDVGSKTAGDVKALVLLCLEHVYPRLSKGAVCVLQDYCDPSVADTWNPWPGVKAAADQFFADKPESVSVLYAGYYTHGFIRKR